MFDLMFTIVPVLVIGMFIYVIVSGIGSWHKNNNSPRLSVPVKIVTKRADTMYTHQEDMMSTSHTTYYVTFEVESGDRIELVVPSREYGFMVEETKENLLSREQDIYHLIEITKRANYRPF